MNGHTVIGEVLTRCKRIPGIDQVVCAIPQSVENKPLELEAKKYAEVFKGDEHDVLGRYLGAARAFNAGIIMRITGDCPLISPELCSDVLRSHKINKADYTSNIEPRTFPKGYDCEVFTHAILRQAAFCSGNREHVTTWMRESDIKRINFPAPWPLEGRLTLDTEDDYKVICAAFGHEPYQCLRAA